MGTSMVVTKARETRSPMALKPFSNELSATTGVKQQTKAPPYPSFLSSPSNESCAWLALVKGEWHPPGDVYPLDLAQLYSFLWLPWKHRFHKCAVPDVTCAPNFISVNDKVHHFSHILSVHTFLLTHYILSWVLDSGQDISSALKLRVIGKITLNPKIMILEA